MNVYNDGIMLNKDLRGGWGNSFHITIGDGHVLFDVGYRGGILMRNIHALGIDVNKIDKLVLSHAHRDHTGGLTDFLKARTTATKLLPIIAHPDVKETKSFRLFIFYLPLDLPKLSERLLGDMSFDIPNIQLKSYPDSRLWVKFRSQNEPRIWELRVKLSIRLMGIVHGSCCG